MAAEPTDNQHPSSSVGYSEQIIFAGDNVRLAGQMDYPNQPAPSDGYPLLFVIPHSTATSRADYAHISQLGADTGAAVFRWDKRGTGRSGSGGGGSVLLDTINAYETAISARAINPQRVVIFAQNEGTLLLSEAFPQIEQVQTPLGVILAGNMLDESAIQTITVPVHIVISKNDWNDWRIYGEAASERHADEYGYRASFYVAMNTSRLLMYTGGNTFHKGTETSMKHWLEHACQISS
jgi:alpha-beta hydrolase superfamily lysophospholipase